jgi:D-sedoheptulose 7-phosphate isomerase
LKTFISVLEDHLEMVKDLAICNGEIEAAGELLVNTLNQGGKILLCGNGGSAADCQHIAAELVVRYEKDRAAMPALALTTDSSILTAHSNDVGFESVFSRQVEAFGQTGDCLVAISTSGKSPNIIKAAKAARQKGLSVIAMTGGDGGALVQHASIAIVVPSNVTARIQEAHILIGHWWCGWIEGHCAKPSNS